MNNYYKMTVIRRPTRLDNNYANRTHKRDETLSHRVADGFLHVVHSKGVDSHRLKGLEAYYRSPLIEGQG